MADKWMAGAFSNKGALHRQLGVPEDQPIPASKLAAAKSKARAQIEKAEAAGHKAPASAVKTSRRVALASRAKTGDISKMQFGGVVGSPSGAAGRSPLRRTPSHPERLPHIPPTAPSSPKRPKRVRPPRTATTEPIPMPSPAHPHRMETGGVVTRARDLVLEGLKEE